MLLQGLGCAIEVQGIVTKAIDVLGLVRTEFRQSFPVRGVSFLQHLPKSAGYGHQRVKGEHVCNKVIVFDKLINFRCSSRTFSAITPSPPKHTRCTNLLNASLLLVAAWIVCRKLDAGEVAQ